MKYETQITDKYRCTVLVSVSLQITRLHNATDWTSHYITLQGRLQEQLAYRRLGRAMLRAADRTSAAGTSWRTLDQDPDDEDDDGGDDDWRNSRRTPDIPHRTRHRLQPLHHRSRDLYIRNVVGKSDHFLRTFSRDISPWLPLQFLRGETQRPTRRQTRKTRQVASREDYY